MKRKWIAMVVGLGSLMLLLPRIQPAFAQSSVGMTRTTTLWM